MILIWAGEGGGPLQWVGIAVFFLQFFAPQIFHLVIDIQNGRLEVGSVPLLTVACSLAVAIFIGALWVVWDWSLGPDEEEGPRGNGNGVSNETAAGAPADASAPSGSAANPVVIDDDNDDDLWQRIYSLLESFSPTHLMLGLGFILPLAMCAPLLLNALQTNGDMTGFLATTGVLQVTGLAVVAHSIMAIAAYRVLRGVLDDGGVGPYPGNRQGRRRRGRKLTVGEIGDIVAKVPIEEFVSEEDIRTGECSVSRLKRMLVNRGALEAAEKCVERDDLVREIERVRKFNDECAICAEEYVEGDVLRVTPCQHEFHLHCFDKWIYTFATDARPATHPTCPLCKATIQ